MRNDLQRALNGAPVAAPMQTQMYGPGTRRMGPASTQAAGATSAIPPYAYGPDSGSEDGEPSRRKVWPWVLVGVIVLLLIAGGIYAFKFASGSGGNLSVPNVDNLTLAQAQTKIVKEHLQVGTTTYKLSQTVKPGHVISTDPTEGTTVAKESAVNLLVSRGVGTKIVPNVFGEQESAARAALAKLGLVASVEQVTNSAPKGQVVGQSPAASTQVPPGSTVTIKVSAGGQTVPSDLVGQSESAAANELKADGLAVQAITVNNPGGFATGAVVSTSPAGGKVVAKGSTVVLYIAAGATSAPPTTAPPTTTPPTTSPPTTTPPTSSSPPATR
jgi:serine/threonine-protein kinase